MAISVDDVSVFVEEGKFVKDGVPALCTCLKGGISVRVIAKTLDLGKSALPLRAHTWQEGTLPRNNACRACVMSSC